MEKQHAVTLLGQWLASVDLEDACLHVPICRSRQKFLVQVGRANLPIQGPAIRPVLHASFLHESIQPLIAFLRMKGSVVRMFGRRPLSCVKAWEP